MADRLEELLALMAAEDEDDEAQEDALALTGAAYPALPSQRETGEDEAAEDGAREAPPEPEEAAEREAQAVRLSGTAQPVQAGGTEWAGEEDRRTGEAGSGLELLYWQTVRAVWPAAQAAHAAQTVRRAPAEEPGRAAALAVDELDRAVRRDSRRYDGGLSIY